MSDREEVIVVRSGAGLSLRVGGTSASWYQPGRILTGSVWDALAAPVAALGLDAPRVLLLGLGGGSAARILREASPRARIVGVERSRAVVEAARASMALDASRVEVHVEDARRFLARPGSYELIVEDCYLGGDAGLTKPLWLPEPGVDEMGARLAPGGLLVCDAVHEAPDYRAALASRFPSLVRIRLFDCTNEVFVASRRPLDARRLRAAIRAHPLLSRALGNLRLRTLARPGGAADGRPGVEARSPGCQLERPAPASRGGRRGPGWPRRSPVPPGGSLARDGGGAYASGASAGPSPARSSSTRSRSCPRKRET